MEHYILQSCVSWHTSFITNHWQHDIFKSELVNIVLGDVNDRDFGLFLGKINLIIVGVSILWLNHVIDQVRLILPHSKVTD